MTLRGFASEPSIWKYQIGFLWLRTLIVCVLVGCGGTTTVAKRQASLRVSTEPANARVFIDDIFVATGQSLSVRPRRLKPGKHLLTIEAPNYFPHDLELELPPGETKVDIKLRPVP